MNNISNIRRLIHDITENLKLLDLFCDAEIATGDVKMFNSQIETALLEAHRVNPELLEESWQIQHLHDRLKALTVSIQIKRNNIERADELAGAALIKCREIQGAIEPPLQADDEL
jgi:phenylacetate-coenzyme A ligase PaaK-like adenylate-forming protein